MNFLIDNWMLISIAAASGGMLLLPAITGGMTAGDLSTTNAVQLMNHEKATVVDVCEPEEFANGHIFGAKNIPLGNLEAQLTTLVKNKTSPLILVCASGVRSGRAVAIAKKLGYEQARSLGGGLKAWRDADLPIEKSSKFAKSANS